MGTTEVLTVRAPGLCASAMPINFGLPLKANGSTPDIAIIRFGKACAGNGKTGDQGRAANNDDPFLVHDKASYLAMTLVPNLG
jgi:hypothetical protein